MPRVPVLYVAGAMRSGSTLLGDLLGSIDGFQHVGELHHVWSRGMLSDWLCSCGQRFSQCEFWSLALEYWRAEGTASSVESLASIRQEIPSAAAGIASLEQIRSEYSEYLAAMAAMVRSLCRASGCRVLVDSSKSTKQASVLAAGSSIDLRVLHLVRDPRAVVYSVAFREKEHIDDPSGSRMVRHPVGDSVTLWKLGNRRAEALADWPGMRYTRLRYEDLVARPEECLNRVLGELGLEGAVPALLPDTQVSLGASHTISGNPDRLQRSAGVRVTADEAWRSELRSELAAAIRVDCSAQMERYGYSG